MSALETQSVREAFQYARGPCDCCRDGRHKGDYEEFDTWLSTTLAEAEKRGAVKALREAAEVISSMYGRGSAQSVYLEEKADRMEAEE